MLSGQLDVLTHNLELYVTGGDTRLKLRHTNRDQSAFDEVMNAEPPVNHDALKHSGSLLARAHRFFVASVSDWLGDPADPGYPARARPEDRVLPLDHDPGRGLTRSSSAGFASLTGFRASTEASRSRGDRASGGADADAPEHAGETAEFPRDGPILWGGSFELHRYLLDFDRDVGLILGP